MVELIATVKRLEKLFSVMKANEITLTVNYIQTTRLFRFNWLDYTNSDSDFYTQHPEPWIAIDDMLRYVNTNYI